MANMILYEGPSLLDGAPIVAIATVTKSRNVKTGNMVQTWILRQDINPIEANRTGADASVCGACPLRGIANMAKDSGTADNRGCYVSLVQAPLAVWKAYKRGVYAKAETIGQIAALGVNRMVRIGSYGDGAAVPAFIWQALKSSARGHTAYSHQHGREGAAFDPGMYMASVDNEASARAAWAKGYRTFRVVSDLARMVQGQEIICPASEEGGKRVTCADCGLCAGADKRGKSIAIVAHGGGKKHAAKLGER